MQKIIIASFATFALAGTALAQNVAPTPPGVTTEQPVGSQAGLDEAGFYLYQEGRQMLGSRLMGAPVWGAESETIGNVDDLLLDENGDVIAIVVGIGGFLGIGSRDVAISTDQLEFLLMQDAVQAADEVPADPAVGAAPVADPVPGAGVSPEPGVAPGATAVPQGQPGNTPAPMGQLGAETAWGWTGAGIDRIQVNYTRAQLESAPEFTYAE